MTFQSSIAPDALLSSAETPLCQEMPWGAIWCLDRGAAHQVRRIRVAPFGRLSLQYHRHRAERWIVVVGTATITIDQAILKVGPGGVVMIPKGSVHRLENLTDSLMEIIEVQTGDTLGEDDIVRVHDTSDRSVTEVRPA